METPAEITRSVEAHLPLKPVWLQILAAIAAGHGHGYAIRKAVERDTAGRVRLWPATLYGTLRQIEEAGLVDEHGAHEATRGKRVFDLTDFGRRVLDAETRRLERLVATIRDAVPAK